MLMESGYEKPMNTGLERLVATELGDTMVTISATRITKKHVLHACIPKEL